MYRTGLLGSPADLRIAGQVHPLLEALEARPAATVERHDLTVQDRVARAELAAEAAQTPDTAR